ncbi:MULTISPECIES: hypothetical protein [Marinobacter]|uniref:Uncharacterized protein n=1 Tax=Marinobacter alkaliphilus TaxID=254719 RepID=A0ABZ3E3L6_9GAMM|nr:hypothetical protein [Marinobacter sp.]MDX5385182.1 hypothetical protein [Marinobacter sp.]MDX5441215.1 hypothetical protein [Alteromonadaceae bacterium]MDX5470885.1 hypothetical protein [Marinobacter sp.]
MKNLPQNEQRDLREIFADLESIDTLQGEINCKVSAISVFDHWLSPDEASVLLQRVATEEQVDRDEKHFCLVKNMVERWDCLTYRQRGRGHKSYYVFKRFYDRAEVLKYALPMKSRRSSLHHFKLVLPEIRGIYIQGFDDTNFLYHHGGEGITELLGMAAECGLHELEVNT